MVVSSRFFERTACIAGIENDETAGAIGRFDHPRLKTGLADQGRLLVAGDAADRDGCPEKSRVSAAEIGRTVLYFGQQGGWNIQQAREVPCPSSCHEY